MDSGIAQVRPDCTALFFTVQICLHSAPSPDRARVCSLVTTRTASRVRPALSLTSAPPTWSSYRRKTRRPSGIYRVWIYSPHQGCKREVRLRESLINVGLQRTIMFIIDECDDYF